TTLWLAIRTPDPVVTEDYYQRGININKTLESPENSLVPAMKGRNHAVTPQNNQPH
ncbi:MAG: FixH family protein, partial [Ottowia sp.]|nr:FixH family protein [Ottowia sp.]